jgi:hypothetical protein
MTVPGVPPNWSNWRGSSYARDNAKRPWRELAWKCAQSARNDAHWPLPVKTETPTPRYLEVEIHKLKPFYDDDGAVSCLKSIIDGMQGVLLYRDSPEWSFLMTPPHDMQKPVTKVGDQCVIITVSLVLGG